MDFDLERDLMRHTEIETRLEQNHERELALELYAALCNNEFRHVRMKDDDEPWSCSWRGAGAIVADLVRNNEDYIDYYCSGNEGQVSPQVTTILMSMGWSVVPYNKTSWRKHSDA